MHFARPARFLRPEGRHPQHGYLAISQGFWPLQRLRSRGERPMMLAIGPTRWLRVASLGFLTLSTPCSPRGLPGLFHPDPALGVPGPFEASLRVWRRTGLSTRHGPQGFVPRRSAGRPSRAVLARRRRRRTRLLHRGPTPWPPWASPLRGILPPQSQPTMPGAPHALCRPEPFGFGTPAPQGLQPAEAQPVSCEIGLAPLGFSTS